MKNVFGLQSVRTVDLVRPLRDKTGAPDEVVINNGAIERIKEVAR